MECVAGLFLRVNIYMLEPKLDVADKQWIFTTWFATLNMCTEV